MKKIILSAALLATTLMGCSDYLDINHNPNYPGSVSNDLLLPSAEAYIAGRVGGNMFNYAGFFCQYFEQAPDASQYQDISEYRFTIDMFSSDYTYLYAGALEDLKNIQTQAEADEAWGDYFVASVLNAYTYQILVDQMDKAPYTEALQGAANPMPKWDNGEDIYADLLVKMDEAEAKLNDVSSVPNDMILGGDLEAWKQFANAMRLRILMRSSYAQDNSQAIKDLINKGNFFTGDIMFDNFSDEADKRNPWYTTNRIQLANNHVASYPIVAYMKATSDPRLDICFTPAANTGTQEGEIPGSRQATANDNKKRSDFSTPIMGATTPVYLYTQAELQFFLAEAYLRFFNDDAKAKAAYEAAIDANFETRGITTGGSVLYADGKPCAWSGDQNAKLELIAKQKWAALCCINHIESWAEIRRLGYPKMSSISTNSLYTNPTQLTAGELISPLVNQLGTGLIKRLYYPQTAVNLNDNTPEQAQLSDKVWWDKK